MLSCSPWNDPSEEARPHSPKFIKMPSLIAFDTLNCVRMMGSSTGSSLFGSKKISITMYLFLNPTMSSRYSSVYLSKQRKRSCILFQKREDGKMPSEIVSGKHSNVNEPMGVNHRTWHASQITEYKPLGTS